MNKYVLTERRSRENTALNKAPEDVLRVAEGLGFEELAVEACNPKTNRLIPKIIARVRWMVEELRISKKLHAGDIVILQSPPGFLCRKAGHAFLSRMKARGIRFVYFIHDIGELREGPETALVTRMLTDTVLSVSDMVVAHNDAMKAWLVRKGIESLKIVTLGIFDYLMPQEDVAHCITTLSSKPSVVIAGNLGKAKSPYIYRLGTVADVSWRLYGPYYGKHDSLESVAYCGSFPPDELPQKLSGNFGLVWDGDSEFTCSGVTGQYLRYNNPHKLSLYLACGLPVIIWAQAAEAKFVKERGIGLVVESLHDIGHVVSKLGAEGYARMVESCRGICADIRDGAFSRKAISFVQDRLSHQIP